MAVETPCAPSTKATAPVVAEIEKPTKPVPTTREGIRIQLAKETRTRMITTFEERQWKEMARKPMTEDPSSF